MSESGASGLGAADLCACKRGFFTLRDCGKPATTTCTICTRRVCDEHVAPPADKRVCVECAARLEEEQSAVAGGQVAAGLGDLGRADLTSATYRYRTRYYHSRNYAPMWWGTYDPYWNDWSTRYYDDDDDDGGGFGNS